MSGLAGKFGAEYKRRPVSLFLHQGKGEPGHVLSMTIAEAQRAKRGTDVPRVPGSELAAVTSSTLLHWPKQVV